MMTTYHLLDGSLLGELPWFQNLTQSADAVALYEDLGPEAVSVGPWLVPVTSGRVGVVGLPQCHGVSTLSTEASAEQLLAHLYSIRQVQTDDGQSFYFRFADTRTLSAASRAWKPKLLAAIKGPVQEWLYTDRYQTPIEFAHGVAQTTAALPQLKLAQFEALINAGQADRIALELQELNEPELQPVTQAQQFRSVEGAVKLMQQHEISRYPVQIEIARKAVLTQGHALDHAEFIALCKKAQLNGHFEAITNWEQRSL
jgi:hypothetical protein